MMILHKYDTSTVTGDQSDDGSVETLHVLAKYLQVCLFVRCLRTITCGAVQRRTPHHAVIVGGGGEVFAVACYVSHHSPCLLDAIVPADKDSYRLPLQLPDSHFCGIMLMY